MPPLIDDVFELERDFFHSVMGPFLLCVFWRDAPVIYVCSFARSFFPTFDFNGRWHNYDGVSLDSFIRDRDGFFSKA